MKRSFFLVICLGLFSGSLGLSQEIEINRKEASENCRTLGYLSFLAVEKFKTLRSTATDEIELDDAKELLEPVALQAFKMSNGGRYKEKLFDEWNIMLTDIFLNEYSDPKIYAKTYIGSCLG
tara:strand:+ start:2875 stop:3240 length:366 start_codon:yes stop_codon:yes gene_type:complete